MQSVGNQCLVPIWQHSMGVEPDLDFSLPPLLPEEEGSLDQSDGRGLRLSFFLSLCLSPF